MEDTNWKTEIVRKVPWSATFLVASFSFFKFTEHEVLGWIFAVVAIITLFLVIRFENYEKIIDRQEKQIENYSNKALKAHRDTAKTLSEANTAIASGFSSYKKVDSETSTK